MDWDHLRHFWALAETGTLGAAARRLGVDQTTVSRRLQALEKQVGQALFKREAAGHRLTEAGRALLPRVEAMAQAASQVESQLHSTEVGPTGLVRLGTTEGCGTLILAPQLARWSQLHPHLSIDLLALPRLVHLSRREADIVISLERPSRGSVVVSRLTDYQLGLYASADYLRQHPAIERSTDLAGHRFVSYVDDLLFTKELQFLDELHRPERLALRSTSVLSQYEAVKAGAGLAVLPAFVVQADSGLVRVLPEVARFTRTFWISMAEEAKHQLRVQATWQFVREAVQALAGRLNPDGVLP